VTGVQTCALPISSAWNIGDTLYVSNTVAGGLTNIKPSVPALSQEMGTVLIKDATAGKIQVISRSTTGNERKYW
jgi:hypothetical protein